MNLNELDETRTSSNSIENNIQLSHPHSDSMASTSLALNTSNTITNHVDHRTISITNSQDRKRKNLQRELNRLEISMNNAEQYTQPTSRLRKRSNSMIPKPTQTKLHKIPRRKSTDNKENANDVIESSEEIYETPKRRGTFMKGSSKNMNVVEVEHTLNDSIDLTSETSLSNTDVLMNVTSDKISSSSKNEAQSSGTGPPNDYMLNKFESDMFRGQINSTSSKSDVHHVHVEIIDQTNLTNLASIAKTNMDESLVDQSKISNGSKYNHMKEKAMYEQDEVKTSFGSTSVTAEQENAAPNGITTVSEENIVLYVTSHEDAYSVNSIISSPSLNQNESKTEELLNNTVDISPIQHSKAVNPNGTSCKVSNEHASMDSLMFPTQRTMCSTQSHKDIKVDLFRFLEKLPSPQVSPLNSIMKKTFNRVTDVNDIKSPNQKRMRVSFNDPPVSDTKVYDLSREEKIYKNGSLHKSYIELKKCALNFDDMTTDKTDISMQNDSMSSQESSIVPTTTISSNKDDILQRVFELYPLEEVFCKYFKSALDDNSWKILTNQLANAIEDEKKRKLILEDLSEKFPKEFLDVALQENFTSTIIERLSSGNMSNMLDHITEQAKIDDNLKTQFMKKLVQIVEIDAYTTQNEIKQDLYKELLQLLVTKGMSDKPLLDVFKDILKNR